MSKSSLRAAMKGKTTPAASEEARDQVADELAIADKPAPLRVAPPPADETPTDEPEQLPDDDAGEGTRDTADTQPEPEPDTEVVPSLDPDPIHVDPMPEGEPGAAPDTDEPAAGTTRPAGQTAQVLASGLTTGERPSPDPVAEKPATAKRSTPAKKAPGPELTHLARVMKGGRDQRRYVSDYLPPRTGRGTNVRLPIHLQDVLAEYCDRDTAPMADLIAAVLDGYFRDLGALPPLGEGNHPRKEFFDELRATTARRTYDY